MDKGDQRTSSSATDQSQTKTAASFHAKKTAAVIGEAPSTSVKSEQGGGSRQSEAGARDGATKRGGVVDSQIGCHWPMTYTAKPEPTCAAIIARTPEVLKMAH